MSSLVYSVANPFLVSVKNQAILKEADISTDTAVTRQSAFSFAQQIYGLKETGGCQIFLVFFSHRYRLVSERYPSQRSLCITELDGSLFIIFIYLLFFIFWKHVFRPKLQQIEYRAISSLLQETNNHGQGKKTQRDRFRRGWGNDISL